MKIIFLGDVVGISGRSIVLNKLLSIIKENKIDFVIVNGENAADSGVGLTEEICKDFFNCGVDVITTGNHEKTTTIHKNEHISVFQNKKWLVLSVHIIRREKILNKMCREPQI